MKKIQRIFSIQNRQKKWKNRWLICGLVALFSSIFNIDAQANGGQFDTKFGSNGFVFTSIVPGLDCWAYDLSIQNDGKIVAVGTTVNNGNNFALVRYKEDGTIDNSFGTNGIVITATGYFASIAYAVAIQNDGKIVIGGVSNSGFNSPNYDFAIARYNSDGSLDNTWGNGGVVITEFGEISESVYGLAIQNDGKIVAVGYSGEDETIGSKIKLVRYSTNGTLDNSFGSAGVVTVADGVGKDVVLQSDGKIIVAGYGGRDDDFIAARYNSNGSADTTFDGDGISYTDFGNSNDKANSVALQEDGKIVVGGSREVFNSTVGDFALARYNTNGELDITFGINGRVTTDFYFNSSQDFAYDIGIQKDGKILAVGEQKISEGSTNAGLVRYNPVGSLDKGFGTEGIAFAASGYVSNAYGVGFQKSGKIVIAGSSWRLILQISLLHYFQLVRFNVGGYSPVPRGSFDFEGDGKTDISLFRPSNSTWYWANSSNGNANQIQFGTSGDKLTPADYDGDWKTDIAIFRPSEGKWYILQTSDNTTVTIQFGSNEDIPLPGYFYKDGEADLAIFRPSNGNWYWRNISDNTINFQQFGTNGDIPIIADFNNDGESDLAFFRPSNGTWYWKKINSSINNAFQFGQSGDLPVPGDYDGDGKTDYAVFRVENDYGIWYLQKSSMGFQAVQFGLNGDRPTPADYDGDGKTDFSVWRSSDTNWYRVNSSNGAFNVYNFGLSGDKPIPSAYIP